MPIPANVMPLWPASVTFFSAAVSESQSVTDAGSTPASLSTSAL